MNQIKLGIDMMSSKLIVCVPLESWSTFWCMNATVPCTHRYWVDDRVEVRLHVNFLTSDTFIYHTTDEVQHLGPLYFQNLIVPCWILDSIFLYTCCTQSGQSFLSCSVFTLWLSCNKALFTDCLHTVSKCLKISIFSLLCYTRM